MISRLNIARPLVAGSVLMVLAFGLRLEALAASFSTTTVDKIPAILSAKRGHSTVAMLFSSRCPLSKNLWPRFLELANQSKDNTVSFVAFSTDKIQSDATAFVSGHKLSFDWYWIQPWAPGALSASMEPTGIEIGSTFLLPLVAVIDSRGKVVGQWQGLQDISVVTDSLSDAISSIQNGAVIEKYKVDGRYRFRKEAKDLSSDSFDDAYDFKNGYARIKREGKWGFLGADGKIAIDPKYNYVWDFDGKRAKVRFEDMSIRYIDMTGKEYDK